MSRRLAVCSAAALLTIVAAAPASAHALPTASSPAYGAKAQKSDSVKVAGSYRWSFTAGDGSTVHGTMNIAKADSGYTAMLTSDHTDGEMPAKSVTVNGGHVVVYVTGDFGEWTADITIGTSTITATYTLVTGDGKTSGALDISRVDAG